MVDLRPYETCRIAGVVERLVIDPVDGTISVFVSDGTATVRAEWAIRRPTPQLSLAPGRLVVLDGTTSLDRSGAVFVADPVYEISSELEPTS